MNPPQDQEGDLEEILDIYGIVRSRKKPPVGMIHLESDDLFHDLEACRDEAVRLARIDELEIIDNGGFDGTYAGYGKATEGHVRERLAQLEGGERDGK